MQQHGLNGKAGLLATSHTSGLAADDTIDASLRFVREHLGVEVAYLSEFVGDDLVFRAVDAPGFEHMVSVAGKMPLDAVYCRHILAGRLPELIPDTEKEPVCQGIPLTHEVPIKSHVSIPVLRTDGTPYGMFCCLSRQTRADLNPRDLEVMRAFAAIAGEQINLRLSAQNTEMSLRRALLDMMGSASFDILYQPIMDVHTRQPKGFESLCRFRSDPYRAPNLWIDDARHVGLQQQLEICLIEHAIKALTQLPDDIYVAVNASPDTVASGALADVFQPWPAERIVLEVTEHSRVDDYDTLLKQLDILRFRGVRLAIDDAGAGYAGLQHIVQLHPDIIKLDISLTQEIDKSVVRRSLGAELDTLTALGVPLAQGYFLGRPADLDTACAWFKTRDTEARA